MNVKNYCPAVNRIVLTVGVLCILYYVLCGVMVRFGQSMLWIWPVAGIVLIARYFLARNGVIALIPRPLLWTGRTLFALAMLFYLTVVSIAASGMFIAPAENVDYLIVLGARVNGTEPSPALRVRVEKAVEYLNEYPETIVIASGGEGDDEIISEAECMKRLLLEAGISEDRIIIEDQSTSTAENIRFSYALIEEEDATVGVVTNSYHMYRARLIAQSNGTHPVSCIGADSSLFLLPHNLTREFMTLVVGFLRGDFQV